MELGLFGDSEDDLDYRHNQDVEKLHWRHKKGEISEQEMIKQEEKLDKKFFAARDELRAKNRAAGKVNGHHNQKKWWQHII